MNKPFSGNSTYTDSLCVFRCLTYHKYGVKCYKVPKIFKNLFYQYFNMYVSYQKQRIEPVDNNPFSFPGIEMEALIHVENCFKININIYNKNEEGTCMILRQSIGKHEEGVNMQEYNGHMSYIANFANYAQTFECIRYKKLFRRRQDYKNHLSAYLNTIRHYYAGGYYVLKMNTFEMLEEVDVYVPQNERYYPHFASYNLEAMMMHVKYTQNNKLKWLAKHIPFCFGVCSNISGYKQPYVYINDDMDELVDSMISYLNQMSANSKLVCEKNGLLYLNS